MKDKDIHFKLSNSFKTLFSATPPSTHVFVLEQQNQSAASADKALFKLNPRIANSLEDVPVDVLRRKSRTKLESLKDEAQSKKFSIFNQKVEANPNKGVLPATDNKKNQPKKCILKFKLDNLEMGKTKSKPKGEQGNKPEIENLPADIVRPS